MPLSFSAFISVSLSSISISSVFSLNYNPTHCFWILQMNLEYPWFVQCFRYNYISFVTLEFMLSLLIFLFLFYNESSLFCFFFVTECRTYITVAITTVMMWNGARELIYNSPLGFRTGKSSEQDKVQEGQSVSIPSNT